MHRGVINEAASREATATTPYHELGHGQQQHLLLRNDLLEILEMADAQHPPNYSLIYAIHGGVTQRLGQIYEEKGYGLVVPRGERRDYLEQVRLKASDLGARLSQAIPQVPTELVTDTAA